MKTVEKKSDILDQKGMERQSTDGAYYDILYNFAGIVTKANMRALSSGDAPKQIAAILRPTVNAFMRLCLIDEERAEHPKEEKIEPKLVLPSKTQEEHKRIVHTALKSNLKTRNGWGLCPKCGRKCVKVNENTILVNHLMFCKSCKKEYPVTWRYEPKP